MMPRETPEARARQVRQYGGYTSLVKCRNCGHKYEQTLPRGMRFGSVAHNCDFCMVDGAMELLKPRGAVPPVQPRPCRHPGGPGCKNAWPDRPCCVDLGQEPA